MQTACGGRRDSSPIQHFFPERSRSLNLPQDGNIRGSVRTAALRPISRRKVHWQLKLKLDLVCVLGCLLTEIVVRVYMPGKRVMADSAQRLFQVLLCKMVKGGKKACFLP